MKTLTKIAIGTAWLAPLFAYAINVNEIISLMQGTLRLTIPFLMILATVVFLWGVIRYVTAGGDEDKLKEGRQFIIFGLVGLFVMVAVWGIVTALVNQFNLGGQSGIPPGPQ